jgi:hypothetical protein
MKNMLVSMKEETHLPTKRLPDDDTSLNLPSSTQLLVHDGDDCIFERNAPHWDGRWAGHIHLPLEVVENNDHDDCIDDDDDDVSSEDEGIAPQSSSSLFLTTARKLIYHWAMLLEDDDDDKCNDDATSSSSNGGRKNNNNSNNNNSDSTKTIVVIPHIVMHPLQQTIRKSCCTTLLNNHISSCQCNDNKSITTDMTATTTTRTTTNNNNLHISLTRPIYLPGPSVSSFMDSIVRDVTLFISIAKRGSCRSSSSASSSATNVGHQQTTSTGRTIYLQPRNAIILTNENHTRSFLCIPISTDSSRWIKHTFLPPIEAIMSRFGLATYYNNNTDDSKDGG